MQSYYYQQPSGQYNATSACIICGRTTSMRCCRCQRAWYCCQQHSEADWTRHQKDCKPQPQPAPIEIDIQSFDTIVDPSLFDPSQYVRQNVNVVALLFDPMSERPQTVTVSCRPHPKSSSSPSSIRCPTPLVQQFFPYSQHQSVVITKGLAGETLRHPLHVFYCPTSLAAGGPVNHSVAKITQGAAGKPWCGTVLVLKYSGTRKLEYTDASMNDLTTLSAYFLGYQ